MVRVSFLVCFSLVLWGGQYAFAAEVDRPSRSSSRSLTRSPSLTGSISATMSGSGSISFSISHTGSLSASGSLTATGSITSSHTSSISLTSSLTATPSASGSISVSSSITSSASASGFKFCGCLQPVLSCDPVVEVQNDVRWCDAEEARRFGHFNQDICCSTDCCDPNRGAISGIALACFVGAMCCLIFAAAFVKSTARKAARQQALTDLDKEKKELEKGDTTL